MPFSYLANTTTMSLRHPAALLAISLFVGSVSVVSAFAPATAGELSAPEFWQFVRNMRAAVPEGVSEVESQLPVMVELVNDTDTVSTFQTGEFPLRHGSVDYLEYRVAKAFPLAVKRLAFDIDKICVRQHAVRKNYPGVKLTDVPRGGAIHEQTYYATTDESGTIGFGFPEHRRYCLQSVVILPPGRTALRK